MKILLGVVAGVAVIAAVLIYGFGVTGSGANADTPILVEDGYVRTVGASAMAGGAYMVIHNQSGVDDRLVAVATDVSDMAELHSNTEDANGVMMMRPITEGIAIPNGASAVLERGGDHVMMMGLHGALTQGQSVQITLTFEMAGDVVVSVPVDSNR